MRNVKKRTTFRKRPKIPGNRPAPIFYSGPIAVLKMWRQILRHGNP